MKLIYKGHSCFVLETADGTLVLDPYQNGAVPGYADLQLKADGVYCSHEHKDHSGRDCVTLSGNGHTVGVEEIQTFHDDTCGSQRGETTIRIFTAEGLRVAHMGDIGCALTPAQKEKLEGLDAILIPVGGYFTVDAGQANEMIEQLKPRVVIPMHYRKGAFGYPVIGEADDFLALRTQVKQLPDNVFELTKDTPTQTVILTICQ